MQYLDKEQVLVCPHCGQYPDGEQPLPVSDFAVNVVGKATKEECYFCYEFFTVTLLEDATYRVKVV